MVKNIHELGLNSTECHLYISKNFGLYRQKEFEKKSGENQAVRSKPNQTVKHPEEGLGG